METIAVYWEPRIKIYGFNKLHNLSFFEFYYPGVNITELGKILSSYHARDVKTKYLTLQRLNDGISLVFCLSEKDGKNFHASFKKNPVVRPYKYLYPVGILFFHGPHFGDRHGVADAAFSPLFEEGIEIISSSCSSASIFLVMAEDDLGRAEEILTKTFDSAK